MFALINLFAGNLLLSFDLTKDRVFSISDLTRNLVRDLDEPVTIYTLFRLGEEDFEIQEMLNQYSSASNNIRIINRDPYIYTEFVHSYARTQPDGRIAPGSIIVESGRRHRVIHFHELSGFRVDPTTLTMVPEFNLEPRVTNAIVFVTQEAELIAYELTGHGQMPLSASMTEYLSDAGYELRQHSTVRGSVPDDASLLIITTPTRDISRTDADLLREFMLGGGATLFLIGHSPVRLPILMELMEGFGVTVLNQLRIHDPNPNFHTHPSFFNLRPHMIGHDITLRIHDMSDNIIFFPNSVPIVEQIVPEAFTLQYLLRTSPQAFLKTSGGTSPSFEQGDLQGQFHIGVGIIHHYAVEGPTGGPITFQGLTREGRIAVIGNDIIVSDELAFSLNRRYVVATMDWLINRPNRDIFIPSRSVDMRPPVHVDAGQATLLKVFVWFVFPAAIMGTGTGVWLVRRNR
jgi:ABC-2 type transport system permease protein